jgi:hypothetical protein
MYTYFTIPRQGSSLRKIYCTDGLSVLEWYFSYCTDSLSVPDLKKLMAKKRNLSYEYCKLLLLCLSITMSAKIIITYRFSFFEAFTSKVKPLPARIAEDRTVIANCFVTFVTYVDEFFLFLKPFHN